jgi:DNA-binding NarL/FixJ family response regulator
MRILWVENHAAFAQMAGRQFLAAHAVTVVPSLSGARAALAGEEFDVVLADFDLDDGKGTDLVESIARLPDRPAVVAASAHDAGNGALLRAGADACCPKLRFTEVEATLVRAVAVRVAAEPARAPDCGGGQ